MVAGSPQFIRCIKPNEIKEAKKFESTKVLKQLRYTGVLETIRIRQNGFSHRFPFADFLKRYCFLGFAFNEKVVANRENCRLLLVRLKMDGWALGKSKVFLKYYHVEILAKLYEERIRKVVLVQAMARRWLAKRDYRKRKREMADSVVTLQRHVRGWLTRKRFEKAKELRDRELQEKRLQEQKKKLAEKLMMTRQELKNKENVDVDGAARVIQNCEDNIFFIHLAVVSNINFLQITVATHCVRSVGVEIPSHWPRRSWLKPVAEAGMKQLSYCKRKDSVQGILVN